MKDKNKKEKRDYTFRLFAICKVCGWKFTLDAERSKIKLGMNILISRDLFQHLLHYHPYTLFDVEKYFSLSSKTLRELKQLKEETKD